MTIQSNIDIKIRQYFRPPDQDDSQSLTDYIRQVEKVHAILLVATYDIYLQYVKKKLGKSSSFKPDKPFRELSSYKKDRSSYKERREYRERRCEEDYRCSSYCRQRDRSRHYKERSSDYKKRDEDRNRYNRDRRDTTRYYDDKRDYKDWKYRDRDYVHFAEGSSGSNTNKLNSTSSSYNAFSSQSSDNDSGSKVAYIVIDANLICYKCYCTFIARRDQKYYVKVYKGSCLLKYKRRAIYNALNPSRRIYSFYSSLFLTYSQLFQYLKTCKDVKNSTLHWPINPASLLAEVEQQTTLI